MISLVKLWEVRHYTSGLELVFQGNRLHVTYHMFAKSLQVLAIGELNTVLEGWSLFITSRK